MKFANIVSALALGTTLLAQPALAQQKLDTAKSEVQFTARQMGVPLDGHFKKFDAQVAFDPAKLATSKITFTVDTGSATSVQRTGDMIKNGRRGTMGGKLTIKGNSVNVVAPVTLTQAGPVTTATGAFPIKRLAFKIGENEWADTSMVADDVQVKFKLALTGVGKL